MMDPTRLINIPCSLITRNESSKDEYGGSVLTETPVETTCFYTQSTITETAGVPYQSITVFLPPDVVPDYVSSIVIEGAGEFQVDGTPIPYKHPRTMRLLHHRLLARRAV